MLAELLYSRRHVRVIEGMETVSEMAFKLL